MQSYTRFVSVDDRTFKTEEECLSYEAALEGLKKAETEYKVAVKAFKEKYSLGTTLPVADGWEQFRMLLF